MSAQYSLHAAQADAVALGQRTVRDACPAVSQQVADDLLAEAVDESPPLALWRKRWTLLLVLFYLDRVRQLCNLRNHRPYFGVRETSPQLHQQLAFAKLPDATW